MEKQQHDKRFQKLRRSKRTSECRERGGLLWHDVEVSLENFANVKAIVVLKNETTLNESKAQVRVEAKNDSQTKYISIVYE